MDLYIHFPIHLHGVVLNYLNTGTTLPTQLLGSVDKLGLTVLADTNNFLHKKIGLLTCIIL
jgi:hypothetical protein